MYLLASFHFPLIIVYAYFANSVSRFNKKLTNVAVQRFDDDNERIINGIFFCFVNLHNETNNNMKTVYIDRLKKRTDQKSKKKKRKYADERLSGVF